MRNDVCILKLGKRMVRPKLCTMQRFGPLTRMATESVFIVRADEILSAFLELERAIHESR